MPAVNCSGMLGFEPAAKRKRAGPADLLFFVSRSNSPRPSNPDADAEQGFAAPTGAAALPPIEPIPTFTNCRDTSRSSAKIARCCSNACVLDLMSGGGLCSLAALDAGAAYVVGVDPRPARVAAAERAFADYGIPVSSYRFVNMEIMPALIRHGARGVRRDHRPRNARTGRCCANFSRNCATCGRNTSYSTPGSPLEAGRSFVSAAAKPQAEFRGGIERPTTAVVATPSHDLIVLLCDYFGFKWRLTTKTPTPVSPPRRAQDARRRAQTQTYVLDRIAE